MFEIFSLVIEDGMFRGSCSLDRLDSDSGLCCPVNLSPVLTESFHAADKKLLKHLKGEKLLANVQA